MSRRRGEEQLHALHLQPSGVAPQEVFAVEKLFVGVFEVFYFLKLFFWLY